MFDLVGLGVGSYGTCYQIVKLISWGLDVASVISLVMGIAGGASMLVLTLVEGIKRTIWKKGLVKTALW